MPAGPRHPAARITAILFLVLFLDQCSKLLVERHLDQDGRIVLVDGFFRLVHWGNTGAAFNLFQDSNRILATFAICAFVFLCFNHSMFQTRRIVGQVSLGLMLGGILGNLADRLRTGHVIDFLYFYARRRDGGEIGFPAFNLADSAIFTGVCLVLLLSWGREDDKPSLAPLGRSGGMAESR